ncbi:hypothetical protein Pmani_010201 [Petrolisthes manimaculis]|uniref:Uncharacterized protein n=1 Tax=Petrolisthes manimaculis TaxID=1843537 RepID=A0AAE1Q2M1_9EUCA|nr:hypothetical protein Pmani_010201 [Petrolisthes manimaculis]
MPKRKFREQWLQEENFRGWLKKVDGDDYSAFCNVCKSTLVTEVSTLKRHSTSRRHTEGLARQTAAPAAQPPPRDGDDDSEVINSNTDIAQLDPSDERNFSIMSELAAGNF